MDPVSLNSSTVAVEASLVRNADVKNTQTLSMLKKSLQGDKDMVQTLLPPQSGMLDIKA